MNVVIISGLLQLYRLICNNRNFNYLKYFVLFVYFKLRLIISKITLSGIMHIRSIIIRLKLLKYTFSKVTDSYCGC